MKVGAIALTGSPIPTPLYTTFRLDQFASLTGTIAPPVGVQVGYTMVACVEAGGYGGGGGTYTMTPDPAWTAIHEDPTGLQIMTNLYTKVADQDDEDGIASYDWTFSTDGGLGGINIILMVWKPRYGTTLSSPSVDHTITPSLASPGGRWQLAYIAERSANAFADPGYPDPVVTSARSTLLAENVDPTSPGGQRVGNARVYASVGTSPITGAYLQTTINFPRYGMVVAAVT